MATKTTFKTVNFINTCGDTYARWAQGSRKVADAVEMTVTDAATGKVVYVTVVSKGGFRRTLADCKAACQANYRVYRAQAA